MSTSENITDYEDYLWTFKSITVARENGCEWDRWTCSNAAKGGHLEVLLWATINGCDWDSDTYRLVKSLIFTRC